MPAKGNGVTERAVVGDDLVPVAQTDKIGDLDALRDFDARALRQVLGDFATGVVVVACDVADGAKAMTVNAFTSVSLDPPLVLVSLGKTASLMAHITNDTAFSISILGDAQTPVASHFGGKPDDTLDEPLTRACGLPVVPGAAAYFGCEVADMVPQGDHILIIGRVQWLCRDADRGVLTFHRGRFGTLD